MNEPHSQKGPEKTLDQFTIIVQAPVDDERGVAETIEALDDSQIVESMRGRVVEKLFYEISVRGQQQIALSWAGVKWFTLQQGHISIEEVRIQETETGYQVIAWAKDKKRDVRVLGAATQSKTYKAKDGSFYSDEFALAKVVSKGQRNALRNLIPEPLVSEAYRVWRDQRTGANSSTAKLEART